MRRPAAARLARRAVCVYGGLLYLTYVGFGETPKGFIPTQDKGYLLVNLQLPDSASVGRTEEVMQRIENDRATKTPGVKHTVAHLRPVDFAERQLAELRRDVRDARRFSQPAGAGPLGRRDRRRAASQACKTKSPTAWSTCFGAPPLEGLGTAGGFKIMIEDRGNTGLDAAASGGRQDRRRRRKHAGLARSVHQLPRQHAVALSRHRPRPRPRRWAFR